MPRQPGLFKRILSYFYPQRLESASSAVNPILDLYYYQGRWQLATADALYSDGIKYRPLLAGFSKIRESLKNVQSVLFLGTGLASGLHILHTWGFRPRSTIVDLDSVILKWAIELLPEGMAQHVTPVCADASEFFRNHHDVYDLVVVDVFIGRYVPGFVTSASFLAECRDHLNPGGHLIMNYMIDKKNDEQKAKAALEAAFKDVQELSFQLNRVFVATA